MGQKFVYKENMFLIFVEKLSIVKIICKGCDRMEHLKPIFFFSLVILFMIWLLYLVVRHIVKEKKFQKQLLHIGNEAEQQLARKLSHRFGTYRVLTNLYLPNKKGATTEIDVLCLCRRGIFILECKHYSGEVFGDEDAAKWYHGLSRGRGFGFYNPIAQNRAHYNALRQVLGVKNENLLHPIVVFCGPCRLKRVKIRTGFCPVIKEKKLFRTMKKVSAFCPRLSRREIIRLEKLLEPYCHVTRREKKAHLKYVKSKK